MRRAIVTTTINSPTLALEKFAAIAVKDDWQLYIVGDKKTPDEEYRDFCEKYEGAVTYLDCEKQEEISKELSDLIGWNCIQRRNFGFIQAIRDGAIIVATIDDDNIPRDDWGRNVRLGSPRSVTTYKTDRPVFDPLSVTHPDIWHRGFPIQELDYRKVTRPTMVPMRPLVQADFWDVDPDVDAVCRITLNPKVEFKHGMVEFTANVMMPFNSQNTFLHHDAFPTYFLFPHIGRMDDIWAGYVLQHANPNSVLFARASVVQERNEHDLTKDLEAEMIGYKHSNDVIKSPDAWKEFVPENTIKAYEVYKGLFK